MADRFRCVLTSLRLFLPRQDAQLSQLEALQAHKTK